MADRHLFTCYGMTVDNDLYGNPAVWQGQVDSMTDFSYMTTTTAISPTGQVIGVNGNIGYLWTSSLGEVPISQLVPQGFQSQVWNIDPVAVSGANVNGDFGILFTANYTTDSNGGKAPGTFLLTVVPGGPNLLFQVLLPPNVSSLTLANATLNTNDLIADIGNITTTDYSGNQTAATNHGLLLVPVDFKQVAPNSGFDWVQSPHWLMVPTSSTNQAIAVTPASSNLTVNFSIQPNSSGSQLSVSPTSTTSTSQTITVTSSGTNTGETYQVQAGVGTTNTSGTNSAGLCLDVKPRTTGTIAIHAVTQHYTQPMAPPSVSGSFTPNQVCVEVNPNGHVNTLTTTPVSPDYENTDQTEIFTGTDGICHTTATAPDIQVIQPGQGIPADIVPQDTPSASDLQAYLNQVFGNQANFYFVVTRNDFSMNYDINKNGLLDVAAYSGILAPEEVAITGSANKNAQYNIYYVHDFQVLSFSGDTPVTSHAAIGATKWLKQTSYVRDGSTPLQSTAHETGHLRDLADVAADLAHDNAFLPSHQSNPASLKNVPDPTPTDRLMYYMQETGTNTYLIKPEWDIVNPNPPQ